MMLRIAIILIIVCGFNVIGFCQAQPVAAPAADAVDQANGADEEEEYVPKTYEEAKSIAEKELTELEELAKPLLALEAGETDGIPEDPEKQKELTGRAYAGKIEAKRESAEKAITNVLKLAPTDDKDMLTDYQNWAARVDGRLNRLGRFGRPEQAEEDKSVEDKAAADVEEDKKEKTVTVFVLPDMGWRDPFLPPGSLPVGGADTGAGIVTENEAVKKAWDDARAYLTVEVIIGLDIEDGLAAVVAGKRVKAGDMIVGDRLPFKIEDITKDTVILRCVTEKPEYEELSGEVLKKKIGL